MLKFSHFPFLLSLVLFLILVTALHNNWLTTRTATKFETRTDTLSSLARSFYSNHKKHVRLSAFHLHAPVYLNPECSGNEAHGFSFGCLRDFTSARITPVCFPLPQSFCKASTKDDRHVQSCIRSDLPQCPLQSVKVVSGKLDRPSV